MSVADLMYRKHKVVIIGKWVSAEPLRSHPKLSIDPIDDDAPDKGVRRDTNRELSDVSAYVRDLSLG